MIQAAALPLVTTTGNELISGGTGIKAGQTVLVAGAAGGVGRSAVFTAKQRGAIVTAGVLKRQMEETKTIGADQVLATDDDNAIANLSPVDAVADGRRQNRRNRKMGLIPHRSAPVNPLAILVAFW